MQGMLVIKAIQFAAEKHKGQERRGSGLPYVIHPIIVMELVQKYKGLSKHIDELKSAALLHDVLEDTECDYTELEREFGTLVATIVMELTSNEVMIKEMGKNEYLKQKMINMSKYAFVLKLLDRLSNVMDGPTKKYLKNTLDMVDYLEHNREEITERQIKIIREIEQVCENKLDEITLKERN